MAMTARRQTSRLDGVDQATAAEHARSNPATVLLTTKLQPPIRRRELVSRRRLIEALCADSAHKLTLIDAPAGWGKTTLLADWHSAPAETRRFAWVSLDRGDNDRARFWAYIIEALRAVEPDVGMNSLAFLRAPAGTPLDALLSPLINDLQVLSQAVVLVLDDYHLITNPEIHEAVAFFIEQLPNRMHVALATRSDPPLPLARLRARREMLEIRAWDLAFDEKETGTLLNQALGLDLDLKDVSRLWVRTEGWVAGLHLAALSLKGQPDASGFIAAFAGNDRHIVDYLGAEILEAQTGDVRAFLLRTSILDRLCGPLCDAVTDTEGSARLLQEIESSNLFLVPLDSHRLWYRYHHLFAELLRHELKQTDSALLVTLHRRAAMWYRDEGYVPEAIQHFIAAGDVAEAAELVALNWNDFLNAGHMHTVDGWLNALPRDALARDARLCLARAGVSLTLGRRDQVDPWLDAAERAPHSTVIPSGATSAASEGAIYRAVHKYMLGDVASATTAARHAVEHEQGGTSPWGAMAFAALGRTLYWRGESTEAAASLQEAVLRAQPPRNNLSVIGALGYLAVIHAERGELEKADGLARRAIAMSDEHGLAEHWVAIAALVARGTVLRATGKLSRANDLLTRAEELARRGAGSVELAFALIALAQLRHDTGAPDDARELLAEARQAVADCPNPGILTMRLANAARGTGQARVRSVQRRAHPVEELSDREMAVLRLLAGTLTQREIGAALHLSENTIKTHTRGIYRKLAASTRSDAVARARELGYL
jgi:LuxR family transcriptional regulator, maltose regulon positive regulatory protein